MKVLVNYYKKILEEEGVEWKPSLVKWDIPFSVEGDLSLNISPLINKKSDQGTTAPEVAKGVMEKLLKKFPDHSFFEQKGYINVVFPFSYYHRFLDETFRSSGKNLEGKAKRESVIIEHTSANPTGPLHWAHFRLGVFGDVLANLYQFQGYQTIREYFINDKGNQITELAESLNYYYNQLFGVSLKEETEIKYPGLNTQLGAKFLKKKWGDKYVGKTLQDLEKEEVELWKREGKDFFLRWIKRDLKFCGIEINSWASEKKLYDNPEKLSNFLNFLAKKGLTYEGDGGALFFKSTLEGDDKDRVLIKGNGEHTYFLGDLLYHDDKFSRSRRLINFWGPEHQGYSRRVLAAFQSIGWKGILEIVIVQISNLLLPDKTKAKFSKRKGNVIGISDLKGVDQDQLRFFCLEKSPNQQLDINIQVLEESQEKTKLYYIKYAHARCHQLWEKAREKKIDTPVVVKTDLLGRKEKGVLNNLVRFSSVVEESVNSNQCHPLVYYLWDLAKSWQTYYQKNRIVDSTNVPLTEQRLLLTKVVQIIFGKGLGLLGIKAPLKM